MFIDINLVFNSCCQVPGGRREAAVEGETSNIFYQTVAAAVCRQLFELADSHMTQLN